jgi:sec-independent protein translocase protein TatB
VFNLSGSEIVFLLVAGLVVLGPDRLPGVIRTVGRVYGEVRRAARGFEKEITETFREPIKDFKDATQDIRTGFGQVDTEPSPPMRPEMPRAMPAPGDSGHTDAAPGARAPGPDQDATGRSPT